MAHAMSIAKVSPLAGKPAASLDAGQRAEARDGVLCGAT